MFSPLSTDEDDFIFPRTATRLGTKFQANVPLAPGPSTIPASAGRTFSPRDTERTQYVADLPDRGEDGTIETLSLVVNMTDEEGERRRRSCLVTGVDPCLRSGGVYVC